MKSRCKADLIDGERLIYPTAGRILPSIRGTSVLLTGHQLRLRIEIQLFRLRLSLGSSASLSLESEVDAFILENALFSQFGQYAASCLNFFWLLFSYPYSFSKSSRESSFHRSSWSLPTSRVYIYTRIYLSVTTSYFSPSLLFDSSHSSHEPLSNH